MKNNFKIKKKPNGTIKHTTFQAPGTVFFYYVPIKCKVTQYIYHCLRIKMNFY